MIDSGNMAWRILVENIVAEARNQTGAQGLCEENSYMERS
jgi:hypothetical protein